MKARLWMALAWSIGIAGHASIAVAVESVRVQEIQECRNGEIATWRDGQDRPAISSELIFAYNPANAPSRFPEFVVAQMVSKAAAAWSQCGVAARLVPRAEASSPNRGVVWVQWNETESRGNFGLANLGQRTISLSAKAFDLLATRNPTYDSRETLQMTISHEMGHVFGLMAHSRRCVDVLSYYHDGKGQKCFKRDPLDAAGVIEYRHTLPTACDIARCKAANGR
jgi:hypothetical protein